MARRKPKRKRNTVTRNLAMRRASSPAGIKARTKQVSSAVRSQSNVSPWKGPRRISISETHRAANRAVTGAIRSGARKTRTNLTKHGRQVSKNIAKGRTNLARGRRSFVRKTGIDLRW
jgi:hypothetical protein